MNDNKLYITITDSRGIGGNASGNASGNKSPSSNMNSSGSNGDASNSESENRLLGRYAEHQMFHLVKSTATKTVNYAISNIGNLTGDYITQKDVNVAKSIVSNMMNVGMATIAGAKFGPVGAVVGFVAGVSSIVVGSVFEDISNRVENAKNNFNIEMLRERVGLNTVYDGSRGTEN